MPDYENILKESWDNIPVPVTLPVGTWRLKGQNATYMPAKSSDQNPICLFVYAPMEPLDDVDEDTLAELGEYDFSSNRVFQRFWMETGRDWDDVRKHLHKHGIDTTGRTIEDSLKMFKGTEIFAWLDVRTYTDAAGEEKVDNSPSNFAAVDD